MGSMGSFEMCLAKNRTYMGKRYVEVFTAKKMVSIILLSYLLPYQFSSYDIRVGVAVSLMHRTSQLFSLRRCIPAQKLM